MAVEDEVIQVGGLLGGEPVQAEVIQNEQIGCDEGPEGAVQGVVDPGLCHGLEEVVGVAEAYGVSGADGRVAQGLGQKGLADAGRSHQEDVFVLVQKLRGEGGVKGAAKPCRPGVDVQRFCQFKWKANLSVGAADGWLM